MKIYRVKRNDGRVVYATKEDGELYQLEGSIVDGFNVTNESVEVDEILTPITPENIYGIGLNYRNHIQEGDKEVPEVPQVFFKATTSVVGPGDEIILPQPAPDYVDYEAELAIVVGRCCLEVDKENADEFIAGYTIANDVSARDCQKHDLQWVRAKSFDTFCPLGPCLSTEPPDGRIMGYLNGKLKQKAEFSDMVFSPREIIEYLSHQFTLRPQTVILTGTPSGVGFAQTPPRYLKNGDEYKIKVPGIGQLSNRVVGVENN